MNIDVVRSSSELKVRLSKLREDGKKIAFVPTMGALHEGHLHLVDEGFKKADVVIASIYVNQSQFNDSGDFENYPRTVEEDIKALNSRKCNVVYLPEKKDIESISLYNEFDFKHFDMFMEGANRPGHFKGVAEVVYRFLTLVQPDYAVFGQKDFQQLAVIRQMTQDLALPVQIIGAPIVRETDGLALSSRNVYLSQDDRQRALSISRSMKSAQQVIWNGVFTVETLREQIRNELTVDTVDYIEFVHSTTLKPVSQVDNETRLLIAAFLSSTRLIDNTALTLEKPI